MKPLELEDKGLPRWLRICGTIVVILCAVLCVRIVWEQTILTWRNGPQMIGFSLVHSSPLALLVLTPPMVYLWLCVLLFALGRRLILKRRVPRSILVDLTAALMVLGVLWIPYGTWQWLFAARLAKTPYASDFLGTACCRGDLWTVKALVSAGVPVSEAEPREGLTPLHLAARCNQMQAMKVLLSKGAALDTTNRYGDSPLQEAIARGNTEVAHLLQARGAHCIKGTDAQKEKAVNEIVMEDIHRVVEKE
ncbi:MAG: hypothetical protein CVU72_01790 [Deltaproteobacteria bacterium HGW-Deltaproteobacteria-7]|nr:MAG: hypothetical protein CVU72_01790 [Deltaproteobacteria bacterium HGW-Deltaproteobacteria-7]